ncbi:hypothetical protein [Cohnella herbarum]|uniref:hypothetical protein n=1 Tax=Cohnella herbarum TaxID=2728023 RepID=UPI0015818538|nr:hypothetical protein [Cohnella herbarum]
MIGGTLGKLVYEDYGFLMPEQYKKYSDGGTALSMEEFANHPAVKNNRIINVTRDKWNYGPYLVDQAVDELLEQVNLIKQ